MRPKLLRQRLVVSAGSASYITSSCNTATPLTYTVARPRTVPDRKMRPLTYTTPRELGLYVRLSGNRVLRSTFWRTGESEAGRLLVPEYVSQ